MIALILLAVVGGAHVALAAYALKHNRRYDAARKD